MYIAALNPVTITAHRFEALALMLLTLAPFPDIDLWRETTECTDRSSYAVCRIIGIRTEGRVLDGAA